jgi:hypothetical protein
VAGRRGAPFPAGAATVIGHGAGLRSLQRTADGRLFVQADGALKEVLADGTLVARATVVARAMGQYVKEPRPVEELRLSPDGRTLAARTAFELHLLPMPADAKPVNLMEAVPGHRQITRIGADTMRWDGDGLSWTVGPFWRHAASAGALAAADPKPPRTRAICRFAYRVPCRRRRNCCAALPC